MKRHLLRYLALALLLSPVLMPEEATAEPTAKKSYSFVVHTRSGEKHTYPVGDKPVLTHDGKSIVITSSEVTMEYGPGTVDRFEMEAEDNSTSSISLADKIRNETSLVQDASTLRISGAKHGDAVAVYSTGGIMVTSAKIASDGSAALQIDMLPKGIYIVKTGSSRNHGAYVKSSPREC